MGIERVKERAMEEFLKGVNLTPHRRNKIMAHINSRMVMQHCCVLWNRSQDLVDLLDELRISPSVYERREVVITKSYNLLYSPDYKKYAPREI